VLAEAGRPSLRTAGPWAAGVGAEGPLSPGKAGHALMDERHSPAHVRFDDRTVRLDRSRSWMLRVLLKLKDILEEGVARVSLHDDTPVYDTTLFPWVGRVEQRWREVRSELETLLGTCRRLPSVQDILEPVGAITAGDRWKSLWLVAMERPFPAVAARCPRTMEVLRAIPGMTNAFFSLLAPGTHIPSHRGAYNGLLRFHLGLTVPQPAEDCWIRVGSRVLSWQEGRGMVFDDTYNHEVRNDTAGPRAVLFVDFARPLHSPFEQLNRALLAAGRYTPMMRRTFRNQRRWEQAVLGGAEPETVHS